MKALKTIVATAVIVFALTTVAMAGVQHFTEQSGQAAGAQKQRTQATYTVTLTAEQLQELIDGQHGGTTTQRAIHRSQTARHAATRVRHDEVADRSGETHTVAQSGTSARHDGTGGSAPCPTDAHVNDGHGGSSGSTHHSDGGEHHSGGEGCR